MFEGDDRLTRLHVWVTFCCLLGLSLSFYAYYVEVKKAENKNYSAYCDINEHISCSKVFTSKYGTGFGLLEYVVGKDSVLNQPNGICGMIFYLIFPVIAYYNSLIFAQIGLAIVSNITSIYLAAILFFVLRNFCTVCVSTYILNLILLMLSLKKLQLLKSVSKLKKAN